VSAAESADTTRPRLRTLVGPDPEALANSMDNEAVYGKKIFEYPLARAIEDGRVADYRIIVPTHTDDDLRVRLNLPDPGTSANQQSATDDALRTTALHLAVLQAMATHQQRRVLVYFNLVEDARRFTRELRRHQAVRRVPGAWGRKYPAVIKLWENAWAEFVPFLSFDVEIRKVTCSTNAIESINARIRKAARARGHFPNEAAAMKCVCKALMNLDPTGKGHKRWTMRRKAPLNAFQIAFEVRLTPVAN
jgi:predicted helicase